ncbi:hypothetical protein FHS43_002395 [Streptosporangium becharense]|uniref:Uncharacterized protein n=1 Tax=Streptosporangium becharense TaxID=1816182 RepID=A0A7W9IJD9_9ACTN|nr:hypothetical protein [Streptosporangium becharense]MBB2911130.1 hypothetical protein [Streptosporangium becharense]MBB5821812.1 hypothetical protein [Streptosporangium becharense]
MVQPRPTAIAIVGISLLAACSANGANGPMPVPSPARTSQGVPSSGPPAVPDPTATGATAASAAWTAETGAKLSGRTALLDVAATGPRDVWAVGYQDSAEDREGTPAAVRWDGNRWREVTPPAADVHHLEGVSAAGPNDVWVVGNGLGAFAARWDGREWTAHSPFGVAQDYRMADVATGGGSAWFAANGPSGAVVLEWRGGRFHNVLSTGGDLEAITVKEGHVWAVGTSENRTPLVWHGTGGVWESARTPPVPGGRLDRVWQISPSNVWAVGRITVEPGGDAARPLVMRWDGGDWTVVEVPVARGALHGVTAFGPRDLWISGVDADHSGQALFLHFDGATWRREYGPLFRVRAGEQQYEESDDVGRTGIARVPGTGALWAVGSVGWGDDEDAFVLRRRGG